MTEPTIPVMVTKTAETRDESAALIQLHEKMAKSIRSWGTWLLFMGVVQLVASGFLEPTFGILLLVVGALSFVFTHPALFIVYATTLAWAAVTNLLSGLTDGQIGWAGFGVLQVFFVYSTLREYGLYRKNEPRYQEMLQAEGIVEKKRVSVEAFPITGCALSILAALLLVTFVVVVMVLTWADEAMTMPTWLSWVLGMAQVVAVLAVGLGAASLASRFRYKVVAILGVVGGALTIAAFLALSLLG